MRAHYATTTPFYRHVLDALVNHYEDVAIQRRFQLDERSLERLRPLLPDRALSVLARRAQEPVRVNDVYTFRRWSFEPALWTRLGRRMPLWEYRSMIRSTARQVAQRSTSADVLQFTDGIGFMAMRRDGSRFNLMERRHVHHDVLAAPMETWRGFPTLAAREPIADVLDEEYERADMIVVYSDAARQTFLDRGFSEAKVRTVHRGASALPLVSGVSRDRKLAIYVGRGDADKGLDLAVGAIEAMNGRAKLKIAGPLTRPVLDWLGDFPNSEYVGLLNREQLSRLHAEATLLLMPSIESFGLAMTDAASAGVRIVCSDTAGIGPEMGAAYSTVVSDRDVTSWAQAVEAAFEEETDAVRSERIANQSIAERYSWRKSSEAMDQIHAEIGASLRR